MKLIEAFLLAVTSLFAMNCGLSPGPIACPKGAYVGTNTTCRAACSSNSSAICAQTDCTEIPFRVFHDSGDVDEGGGIYSAGLDRLEISWRLPGVHCTATTPGEFTLADPTLGERKVPYSLDGARLITGTGAVWSRPTASVEGALSSAVQSLP